MGRVMGWGSGILKFETGTKYFFFGYDGGHKEGGCGDILAKRTIAQQLRKDLP